MQMQNQNYEQIVVIAKTLLDNTQCDELIARYDNNLQNIVQKTYRDVLITDIPILDIPHLLDSLQFINQQHFKLDLYLHWECFFARYDQGMHYDSLHIDCIAGDHQRKLSFSLLLNDDFQGGDFATVTQSVITRGVGKLLVFPSFLPHKISPVESGTRYVIFGWIYGPNFK